jgi:hypothetical protein
MSGCFKCAGVFGDAMADRTPRIRSLVVRVCLMSSQPSPLIFRATEAWNEVVLHACGVRPSAGGAFAGCELPPAPPLVVLLLSIGDVPSVTLPSELARCRAELPWRSQSLTEDAASRASEDPNPNFRNPEFDRFSTERASAGSNCNLQPFRHTIHNSPTLRATSKTAPERWRAKSKKKRRKSSPKGRVGAAALCGRNYGR